jgi:hypothetical protein
VRLPITVQLSQLNPAGLRAVSALRAHPRLQVRIAAPRGANVDPRGRVLRIEPGSRLEPVLTLLWGARPPVEADILQREARLGLSSAILGRGPSGYEWSGRTRPLPERVCVGSPDPNRPWVLVAPHARVDCTAVAAASGLMDPQLHYLKPRPDSTASEPVWWLPTRNVLLSLLGRVHAVVASQGPLAWDAARIGVPVIEPEPVRALPAAGVERRLACMVPGSLVDDEAFWSMIGSQLVDGIKSEEWGTTAWTLLARDGVGALAGGFAAGKWQRKLLKLKRDPARFWADSKVVKRLTGSPH